MTMFSVEFDIVASWEQAGRKRAWLKAHEGELRALASQQGGWASVAEALEGRGWSTFWGTRPLSGEWLAREMAVVAYRKRHQAERRQQRETVIEIPVGALPIRGGRPTPRRLVEAIAAAVVHPISSKIDELAAARGHTPAAAPAAVSNPAPRPLPKTGDPEVDRAIAAMVNPPPPPSPTSAGARLRQRELAARSGAPPAGEITPATRLTKQLILDPTLQPRAATGVSVDFEIPIKTEEN